MSPQKETFKYWSFGSWFPIEYKKSSSIYKELIYNFRKFFNLPKETIKNSEWILTQPPIFTLIDKVRYTDI